MATYQAIAATSQAIQNLLKNASMNSEFNPLNVELYHLENFSKPMDEGVSLFLYRISLNGSQRRIPSRMDSNGKRYFSPLPVDLYYMLTPWAKSVLKQQRLLGWCMRVLDDTPILPMGLLNHNMPEKEIFHSNEQVELICDPMSLQDIINLWENLRPKLQTSITYVARLILLESTIEIPEHEMVQTRELQMGDLAK